MQLRRQFFSRVIVKRKKNLDENCAGHKFPLLRRFILVLHGEAHCPLPCRREEHKKSRSRVRWSLYFEFHDFGLALSGSGLRSGEKISLFRSWLTLSPR